MCNSGERKEVIRLIQTVHASDSPFLIENVKGQNSGVAAVKTRTLGTDTDVDHLSLDTNSGDDTQYFLKAPSGT